MSEDLTYLLLDVDDVISATSVSPKVAVANMADDIASFLLARGVEAFTWNTTFPPSLLQSAEFA